MKPKPTSEVEAIEIKDYFRACRNCIWRGKGSARGACQHPGGWTTTYFTYSNHLKLY